MESQTHNNTKMMLPDDSSDVEDITPAETVYQYDYTVYGGESILWTSERVPLFGEELESLNETFSPHPRKKLREYENYDRAMRGI